MSTVVLVEETVATNITATLTGSTCPKSLDVNLRITPGASWRYGPTLPSTVTVDNSSVTATRTSVTNKYNSLTLSPCELGGQLPENQLAGMGNETGGCFKLLPNVTDPSKLRVAMVQDNCTGAKEEVWEPIYLNASIWAPKQNFVGGQPPSFNFKCSSSTTCLFEAGKACEARPDCISFGICPCYQHGAVAEFFDANKTAEAYEDPPWTLFESRQNATLMLIRNPGTNLCLQATGSFVKPKACPTADDPDIQTFAFEKTDTGRISSLISAECITAAFQNPVVHATVMTSVVQQGTSNITKQVQFSQHQLSADPPAAMVPLALLSDVTYSLVSTFSEDFNTLDAAKDLATKRHSALLQDMSAAFQKHQRWWDDYWTTGASIDLGPHRLLEG